MISEVYFEKGPGGYLVVSIAGIPETCVIGVDATELLLGLVRKHPQYFIDEESKKLPLAPAAQTIVLVSSETIEALVKLRRQWQGIYETSQDGAMIVASIVWLMIIDQLASSMSADYHGMVEKIIDKRGDYPSGRLRGVMMEFDTIWRQACNLCELSPHDLRQYVASYT